MRKNHQSIPFFISWLSLAALLSGCNYDSDPSDAAELSNPDPAIQATSNPEPGKNLYFGDLHVHTSVSMDALLWGNRLGMDEAYGFARGEVISLPSGAKTQLSRPLDFVAITDHASSFETTEFCFSDTQYPNSNGLCERFEKPSNAYFEKAMKRLRQRPVTRYSGFCDDDEGRCLQANAKTWQRVQDAANKANEPGQFTAFVAYEFSPALPKQGKIHRNVLFRGAKVPNNAISIYDAETEIDLWKGLTKTCLDDCDFLTIPHNLNLTWGFAFAMRTIDGDLYSEDDFRLRATSEPIAEIFQSKGASECALGLGVGTVDEECQFEQLLQPCAEGESQACAKPTSYAREGLKMGLELQEKQGFNPFKIGFIGSTDTHNTNPGDTEESDYQGAMGMLDDTPEKRYKRDKKRHPQSNRNVLYYNPGGLAAIWAKENTRDALFDAMKTREVYATSGTRIGLKMYAGWDLDSAALSDREKFDDLSSSATPMGGELTGQAGTKAPEFFIWATKDINSANLQRIQIVKGWIEDGERKEQVQDIACADGAIPNPATNRCPDNGATVDLTTCALSNNTGAAELQVAWKDATFNPDQLAFYYARVIEDPVCRWSTHDAIRISQELKPQVSGEIQERAWSSPIWYTPS